MKLTGQRNQCPTCGLYFNTNRAFDAHRRGKYASQGKESTRRCLTEAELLADWWGQGQDGFMRLPVDPLQRERLSAMRRKK